MESVTQDLSSRKNPPQRPLVVRDYAAMGYVQALELQHELCQKRQAGLIPNTVLILEHPPVITLGARKTENKLLVSVEHLNGRGIELVQIRRGGGATAHNPGQLVFYPIVRLKSLSLGVNEYICRLEDIGIELLSGLGVQSERKKGYPGLWVDGRKIASIGVRIKRWVTMHGMAININNDLEIFKAIVPCGIEGVRITSVQKETSAEVDMQTARKTLGELCVKYLSRQQ